MRSKITQELRDAYRNISNAKPLRFRTRRQILSDGREIMRYLGIFTAHSLCKQIGIAYEFGWGEFSYDEALRRADKFLDVGYIPADETRGEML